MGFVAKVVPAIGWLTSVLAKTIAEYVYAPTAEHSLSPSIVPNSGPPARPKVGATPVASASFSARPCIAATPPSMRIRPHEKEKQPATPA